MKKTILITGALSAGIICGSALTAYAVTQGEAVDTASDVKEQPSVQAVAFDQPSPDAPQPLLADYDHPYFSGAENLYVCRVFSEHAEEVAGFINGGMSEAEIREYYKTVPGIERASAKNLEMRENMTRAVFTLPRPIRSDELHERANDACAGQLLAWGLWSKTERY
tara:strand:- start:848 stop:1345 length:498 start_codon:yes stop_codon:yes gene_type:complete